MDILFLHNQANIYYNNKQWDLAILKYTEIINITNDYIILNKIFSNRSACYLQKMNWIYALTDALESLKYNLYNPISWGRIGWGFKGLQHNKKALEAFYIANSLNKTNKYYINEIKILEEKIVKKIDEKVNSFEIFNIFLSDNFIMDKMYNTNFRNKILKSINPLDDKEIFNLIDYILDLLSN
jgi:hypothetical protein